MLALFMERCCWEDHNADWANWGNNQHSEDRSQISYSSLIYLEANFLLSHFSNYKKIIWNLEKKENRWKLVKELIELAVELTHYEYVRIRKFQRNVISFYTLVSGFILLKFKALGNQLYRKRIFLKHTNLSQLINQLLAFSFNWYFIHKRKFIVFVPLAKS